MKTPEEARIEALEKKVEFESRQIEQLWVQLRAVQDQVRNLNGR